MVTFYESIFLFERLWQQIFLILVERGTIQLYGLMSAATLFRELLIGRRVRGPRLLCTFRKIILLPTELNLQIGNIQRIIQIGVVFVKLELLKSFLK